MSGGWGMIFRKVECDQEFCTCDSHSDDAWEPIQPIGMRPERWPQDKFTAACFVTEHVKEPGNYALGCPNGFYRVKVALRGEAVTA